MTDVAPAAQRRAHLRRPRGTRLGLWVMTVVSAAVLVGVLGAQWYIGRTVEALQANGRSILPAGAQRLPAGQRGSLAVKPKIGQPFTVLILGVDSREGTSGQYGPNSAACGCSDTIMLARVNPQTGKVALLSIPRDSRVYITGRDVVEKINSAYSHGPDNSVATIEKALNIPINHWVVVDLEGFSSIVDAIGGIRMNFPYQLRDKNAGLFITATGCQAVNGTTALAISRSRELQYLDVRSGQWVSDPTYEYGRSRREQILLKVIAAHTVKQSLSNPLTARVVINTFTGHNRLAVDNQTTGAELLNLAGAFAGFNAAGMQTFTLPTYTSKLYDPVLKLPQDFEILEPDADVATITAWYQATEATTKATPTSAVPTAASARDSTTTTPTAGRPTSAAPTTSTAPPGHATVATPSTASPSAAAPNQPRAWDPVPCS